MNKHTATIAFQILPWNVNDKKMLDIIDKVIAMVKESRVKHEVGPMETTMEGDLDTLFAIVRKAQDICIQAGAPSVFTNVKILYGPEGVMTIEEKVTKHRK